MIVTMLTKRPPLLLVLGAVASCLYGGSVAAEDNTASIFDDLTVERYGSIKATVDYFPRDAAYQNQDDVMAISEVMPVMIITGDNAEMVIEPRVVTPKHGHGFVDLKDGFITTTWGEMDLLVGATTEFWGKNEAANLVDIINTKDYTMGLQSGEKQGMPMVRLGQAMGPGYLDLYVMPIFIENRYAGAQSRMRPNLPYRPGVSRYQIGTDPDDVATAIRYSGYSGDIDYGISAFQGITRDPGVIIDGGNLLPLYHEITQYGVDLQWTTGETIYKTEMIQRYDQLNQSGIAEDYTAGIAGFEHTLYGVMDSNGDLAVFGEYAKDSRGDDAASGLQNDLFFGGILSMNDVDDTQYRVIIGYDLDEASRSITAEYSRRLTTGVTLEASVYHPDQMSKDTHFFSFDRDTRLHTAIKYSW